MMLAVIRGYRVDRDGQVVSPAGRPVKATAEGHGYLTFGFRLGVGHPRGTQCAIKVHRLQAFQKFGKAAFEPGIVVRHMNGNRLDASWDNIEIGTHRENSADICKVAFGNAIRASNFRRAVSYYPGQRYVVPA